MRIWHGADQAMLCCPLKSHLNTSKMMVSHYSPLNLIAYWSHHLVLTLGHNLLNNTSLTQLHSQRHKVKCNTSMPDEHSLFPNHLLSKNWTQQRCNIFLLPFCLPKPVEIFKPIGWGYMLSHPIDHCNRPQQQENSILIFYLSFRLGIYRNTHTLFIK